MLGTSGDFNGLAPDPVQLNCFIAGGSAIKFNPGTSTQPAFLYHDPHYVVFGQQSHCTVPRTIPSQLTLTSVEQFGNLLAVTGTMSPPVSGQVMIDYTPPDGNSFSHTVTSDANGNFSDTVDVPSDQVGRWAVRARWFGQGYYIGSSSDTTAVDVAPPSPPPPPPPGGATLTITCPSGTATDFPSTQAVTGTLTPAVAGSPVTVTYTPPTGAGFIHTASTDASGAYSDTFTIGPTQIYATWTVHAHFAGDSTRSSADSFCTFVPHYP